MFVVMFISALSTRKFPLGEFGIARVPILVMRTFRSKSMACNT